MTGPRPCSPASRGLSLAWACAWAAVSAAGGEPSPPAALEVGGTTIEFRAGEVVARRDGAVVWSMLHPALTRPLRGRTFVTSPVALDGHLYYGTGCYVLRVDVAAGRVVARLAFPDAVKSLRALPEGVEVTYGRAEERYAYDGTFLVTRAGGDEPRTFLSGDHDSALVPAHDAIDLCGLAGVILPWGDPEVARPDGSACADALELLGTHAGRDPTNPFLRAARACVLAEFGRLDDAREEAARARAVTGAARMQLLLVANWLEKSGLAGPADEAFEAGYRAFLEAGNEPEQLTSIIAVVRHCGNFACVSGAAAAAGDVDTVARVLGRLWRIAPLCEGATLAFGWLADACARAGRSGDEALWRSRAADAAPSLVFGGALGSYFAYASQGLNAVWAVAAALEACLLVLVARVVGARLRARGRTGVEPGAPRDGIHVLIRRHLSTREIAGMALLGIGAYVALWFSWVGAVATRMAGSLDLAVRSGSWGSPAAVMDWAQRVGNQEGRELYGLALLQAGRLDEASALLRAEDASAEACNNYGVCLARKGRPAEARDAFARSLELDPGLQEALYNLGRRATGVRVERARAYLPGRPLVALPAAGTCARALAGKYEGALALSALPHLLTSGEGTGTKLRRVAGFVLGIACAGFVVALALVRVPLEPEARGAAWWLGAALPGVARPLAPVGALALAAYFYCAAILACDAWARTPGVTSVLESLNLPIASVAFGLPVDLSATWRGTLLAAARWYVWLAVVANAAAVVALRVLRPASTAPDGAPAWWAAGRGAAIAAAGVWTIAAGGGSGYHLLGASLVAAGIASAAEGVVARRGRPSAAP